MHTSGEPYDKGTIRQTLHVRRCWTVQLLREFACTLHIYMCMYALCTCNIPVYTCSIPVYRCSIPMGAGQFSNYIGSKVMELSTN